MPARQPVDVLSKRATRASNGGALEAMDLNTELYPLVQHGPLGQASRVAGMPPAAPAATARTRCTANGTARVHEDHAAPLDAADNLLAHTGEDAIEDAGRADHMLGRMGAPQRPIKSPGGASHKVRKTHLCFANVVDFALFYNCGETDWIRTSDHRRVKGRYSTAELRSL